MTHHYIVWSPKRTEGFVTNDADDAEYVRCGFRAGMAVSTAGQAFREAYLDEDDDSTELPMTEINMPDGIDYLGVDLAKAAPADPQIEVMAKGSAASLFAVEMLDFQPLTGRNSGARLWQILEAGGIPDGMQVPALLGALRHALGVRA